MPDAYSKLVGILLATTFSVVVEFAFIIVYVKKKYPIFTFKFNEIKDSLKGSWLYIKTALPVALQWSMIYIGFIAIQGTFVNFDNLITAQTGVISHNVVDGKSTASTLNGYACSIVASFGSAIMSYTAQNYGAKNYDRIRQGAKQFIVMFIIIYAIINFFTFLLVYNGTGLYLFLDPDYINDSSKWYFSTYYLIVTTTLIINCFVMCYRNILQGIQKNIFPLISSIGELVARIIVAKVLIYAVNPSNPASNESFIMAAFGEPIAWTISASILVTAGIVFIHSKNSKYSIFAGK